MLHWCAIQKSSFLAKASMKSFFLDKMTLELLVSIQKDLKATHQKLKRARHVAHQRLKKMNLLSLKAERSIDRRSAQVTSRILKLAKMIITA